MPSESHQKMARRPKRLLQGSPHSSARPPQLKDPYTPLDAHHSGHDLSLGASSHLRGGKRRHFPSALGPPLWPLRLLIALNLLRNQPLRRLLHDADRFTAKTPARRHNEHSSHKQKHDTFTAKTFWSPSQVRVGYLKLALTFFVTLSDRLFQVHLFSFQSSVAHTTSWFSLVNQLRSC